MARNPLKLFYSFVYGSAYVILYVVLIGLLLITPGDAIERSIRNQQRYNVIILTAAYVVTIVIVMFTYATRLYVNKTALAAIPKQWVPIDKGDVKKIVYKMIAAGLDRSAVVAFEARPRVDVGDEPAVRRLKLGPEEREVEVPPRRKPWGDVEHKGWASPNSPDLPDLQYSTVISELPNLIEAKVLTLAPPDPTSQSDPPTLDPEAVSLLQKQPNQTLRDYISHLSELGVLDLDESIAGFLQLYEHARFSNRPIPMKQFRELMHLFAETLRAFRPLDLSMLDEYESDIDNNAPLATNPSTAQRTPSRSSTAPSARSAQRLEAGPWFSTAPNTPSKRTAGLSGLSRRSSNNSFAQTRQPYAISSQPSSASLRSAGSGSGSVIRLATREDDGDSVYVLNAGRQRQHSAS